MDIALTVEERDYILEMLSSFKDSLDECCDKSGTVLLEYNWMNQEDVDKEYKLINSLFEKLEF